MMNISIYEFLAFIDETNRATEVALRHAVEILKDLTDLPPASRKMVTEILVDILADENQAGVRMDFH